MKRLFGTLLGCAVLLVQCGYEPVTSETKFYSADAHEIELQFTDEFQIPLVKFKGQYDKINVRADLSEDDRKVFDENLKLQILHLYGVFTYHEKPTDFSSYSGSIYEREKPKVRKLTLDKKNKVLKVKYRYKDRGVFFHWLLEDWDSWDFKFYMPNEPSTIYKKTLPKNAKIDPKTKDPIHPCTDEHDPSEAAFWYYWSPDRKGCPKTIFREMHLVEASFKKRPSTTKTFPVYRKLHKQDEVNVTLFVGQDEKFGDVKDLGRKTYEHEVGYFKNLKLADGSSTYEVNEIEEFHTELTYKTDQFTGRVQVYYIDTETEAFDEFAKAGLVESDLMIFSGHSYEGYYFDLNRLYEDPKESLPKDKYQVMYFNACTTTSYYRENYFAAKEIPGDKRSGRKHLDIVTNAIGAPFMLDAKPDDSFKQETGDTIMINSLFGLNRDGRPMRRLQSWQEILGRITTNVGYDFTALTSVHGDEYNPKRLARDLKVPQPKR